MVDSSVFSLDNVVMSTYVFYGCLMVLKLFAMALWTSLKRITKRVYATPEDFTFVGPQKDDKPAGYADEEVERVRRNHMNDLENIPAFLFLGLFYVLTKPSPYSALWHFRVFAISRFVHVFAHLIPLPQPARATCYTIGLAICVSMALQTLSAASY